jgi:hypothetical protein
MSGMTLQDWINTYIPQEQEKNLMKVTVTHTDTFCGEPNYGWVKRHEFVINRNTAQHNITRKAKSLAGMTGVKSDTFDYDTGLTIKPRGYHQVIFVDFE